MARTPGYVPVDHEENQVSELDRNMLEVYGIEMVPLLTDNPLEWSCAGQFGMKPCDVSSLRQDFDVPTDKLLVWLRKIVVVGSCDFAVMVSTYFIGRTFGGRYGLPIMTVKAVASALVQQQYLIKPFHAAMREQTRLHPEEYVAKILDTHRAPYLAPGGMCACALRKSLIMLMLAVPESIDTTADAFIAGSAMFTTSKDMEFAFVYAWKGRVFHVGDVVAGWGLCGSLNVVLLVSSTCQFVLFLSVGVSLWRLILRRYTKPADYHSFFLWVAVMAEACSLTYVSRISEELSIVFISATVREPTERPMGPALDAQSFVNLSIGSWKAFCKGCMENIPTLWIQSSLLGLAIALEKADRLWIVLASFSIFTSFVTLLNSLVSVRGMGTVLHLTREEWQSMETWAIPIIAVMAIANLCFLCALLATSVHVVGIVFCPSHNFEITTFDCTVWKVAEDVQL